MDQTEFVQVIKKVVTDSTIRSIEELITEPPGRMPQKKLIELSNWFKTLSEDDKKWLRQIIKDTASSSVFSFLCVLDGVKAIEAGGNKGKLLLYYERDGEQTLINDFDKELLHDIYNSL